MGLFDGDHFGIDYNRDGRTSIFESAVAYDAMRGRALSRSSGQDDLWFLLDDDCDDWRDDCEPDYSLHLDLDDSSTDYDSPRRSDSDWREDAWVEGLEHDLDPEDFDTWEEFEEALEDAERQLDEAKRGTVAQTAHVAHGSAPVKPARRLSEAEVLALLPCDALGISVRKKPKPGRNRKGSACASYPNQRMRALVLELAERMGDGPNCTDYCKELRERCEFALKSPRVTAARYITVEGEFLYAQAACEHFTLPFAVPTEDEAPKTSPDLLVKALARKDAQLAADVWTWLVDTFVPYLRFCWSPERAHLNLTAGVIFELAELSGAPLLEAIDRLECDDGLRRAAFAVTSQPIWGLSPVLLCALANGRGRVACLVLGDALGNVNAVPAELANSLGWVVHSCTCMDDYRPAELLKTHVLPLLDAASQPELQARLPAWKDALARYLGEKKYPLT